MDATARLLDVPEERGEDATAVDEELGEVHAQLKDVGGSRSGQAGEGKESAGKQPLGYTPGVLLRRAALWTLLAFGCTTVRAPVTALEQPADAPGTIAPPITELWLESSEEVPPAIAASADARARASLSAALADLEVPANAAGATDAVLFVRERAVGLTEERKSQQNWAKVGIVVGIVVVAAVAVFLAVKGSKGSSAPANAAPAPSAPAPVAVKPHVVPVTPRPPVPPSVGHAVPLPGPYRPAPIQVGFFFEFWIPPRPLVLAPEAPPEDPWGAPGPLLALDGAPPDLDELAEPPPPDPGPMSAVALQLPPLAEAVNFPVEDRSFFAGPHTALQLDLIDRASGRLLWSKAVAGGEDPLDEGAMSKLLDEALEGQRWARRSRR